jgi:hypothetical protein
MIVRVDQGNSFIILSEIIMYTMEIEILKFDLKHTN